MEFLGGSLAMPDVPFFVARARPRIQLRRVRAERGWSCRGSVFVDTARGEDAVRHEVEQAAVMSNSKKSQPAGGVGRVVLRRRCDRIFRGRRPRRRHPDHPIGNHTPAPRTSSTIRSLVLDSGWS
jgi:hypothetical protein